MKKILLTALVAMTLFACSNEDKEGATEGTNLKSLEFTLGVATPKTRMSDETVTGGVAAAVRTNVKDITLEYFNAAGASLGTYNFTGEDIIKVKGDDQSKPVGDADRKPVKIENIPGSTAKVNVYLNVQSATNINDLQIPYKEMEYRGEPTPITLSAAGGGKDGNDLYRVEVEVKPVLSRFEFKGDASTLTVNKDGDNKLPAEFTGTKEQLIAKGIVSEATILAAEKAARDEWKKANPGAIEPAWTYTDYAVSYKYNSAYTIESIDGYYMNYIPVTAGGALVQNSNDANGNWNTASAATYTSGGTMKNMFDTTVESSKNIAYNLFPQTSSPAENPTVAQVKATMPHFILKLATKDDASSTPSTRWLTIRALSNTANSKLITSFEAGKVYVLDAADININQYSALLKVTANGTVGPEIPDPVDPTDPNPEPVGKDLDVLVKILNWDVVNVKPEW